MSQKSLGELSKKMRDIDFVMLSTRAVNGAISGRPMSNNGDVEYDGDSYFFTFDKARMVDDIKRDPAVALFLSGSKSLLGKPPIFISVQGKAELIHDKQAFAKHWTTDIERWFKDGVESVGLVLIKVHANRIHYWDGEENGDIAL